METNKAVMRDIATTRLSLVPQTEAHAIELFAVLGDPALYVHEGSPPDSISTFKVRLRRLESRLSPDGTEHWLNWVVKVKTSDEVIGYIQATVDSTGRAFLAYMLGSKDWGQGLASEAVTAMMDELTDVYGVKQFCAVLKAENTRSMNLLIRKGFVRVDGGLTRIERDEVMMERPPAVVR